MTQHVESHTKPEDVPRVGIIALQVELLAGLKEVGSEAPAAAVDVDFDVLAMVVWLDLGADVTL